MLNRPPNAREARAGPRGIALYAFTALADAVFARRLQPLPFSVLDLASAKNHRVRSLRSLLPSGANSLKKAVAQQLREELILFV